MATELDQMVIVIGPPKAGKTTIVRQLVVAHLMEHPSGIALVHDSNGDQFRDICAVYDSTGAYRTASQAAAVDGKPFPRGAAFTGMESSAIRDLAVEIARQHNAADNVKVPIMLAYDETAVMDTSGSTWIDRDDREVGATRRHKGIAPVFNLQSESDLAQPFFRVATDVLIFGQTSIDAVGSLEKKLGLAKGALARTLGMPRFMYAHWKQGEGLV